MRKSDGCDSKECGDTDQRAIKTDWEKDDVEPGIRGEQKPPD